MGNLVHTDCAAGSRGAVRIQELKFGVCLAVLQLVHNDTSFS